MSCSRTSRKHAVNGTAIVTAAIVIVGVILSAPIISNSGSILDGKGDTFPRDTRPASSGGTVYAYTIGVTGVTGSDNAHFDNPEDATTNETGAVYVADASNHRVQVFDAAGAYLYTIGVTGVTGTDNAHFNYPWGVAINSSGDIYVVDSVNYRVQVFDVAGNYLYTIGVSGVSGSDNSHFNAPTDAIVNSSGALYVADQSNHRVQVFDVAGNYLYTIGVSGVSGSDNAHFNLPTDVAVNSSGALYVADQNNHRVQVFDNAGNYLYTIGTTGVIGTDEHHFNWTNGVAINSSDELYVADYDNHRVQVFDAAGAYLYTIGVTASYGSDNAHFYRPRGLCVNGSGALYVADLNNERIQVFKLIHEPVPPLLQSISPSTSTTGTVDLDWDDAPAGQTYTWDVYRSTSPIDGANYGSLTPIATGLSSSAYQDQVSANGTYYYAVLAVNGSGEALSNCESVVVAIPPNLPVAPVLQPITPSTSTTGTVDLDWDDAPAGQPYTWDVYRSTSPITEANYENLKPITKGLKSSSFRDNVTTNGTYYYAVLAVNGSGEALSNCENVTVAIPPAGSTGPDNVFALDIPGYEPVLVVIGLAAVAGMLVRKREH
ncbi:MAG: 6-bladed beta-propeller [Promethearchaeota archaeon]